VKTKLMQKNIGAHQDLLKHLTSKTESVLCLCIWSDDSTASCVWKYLLFICKSSLFITTQT